MPTQDVVIPISLNKGIDTKSDNKQGANGRLLSLYNAVFTGVNDIEKRFGYESIPNTIAAGSSISSGNSISTFEGSLYLNDGTELYGYSPNEQEWADKGAKTAVAISSDSIGSNGVAGNNPQMVVHTSNIALVTWVTSDTPLTSNSYSVKYSYIDMSTRDVITSGTFLLLDEVVNAIPIVFGDSFYLIIEQKSSHYITSYLEMSVFNYVQPLNASFITLFTTSSTSIALNSYVQTTSNLFILYVDDSDSLILKKYDSTLTNVATATVSTDICTALEVDLDRVSSNLNVFFASSTSNSIKYASYDIDLNVILAVTSTQSASSVMALGSVGYDSDYIYLYYSSSLDSPNFIRNTGRTIVERASGTAAYNSDYASPVLLSVKPFYKDEEVYVGVSDYSTVQPTLFITKDLNQYPASLNNSYRLEVVAKYSPLASNTSYTISPSGSLNYNISLIKTCLLEDYYFPHVRQTNSTYTNGEFGSDFNIQLSKLSFSQKLRYIELANNLNSSGGIISICDGVGVAESGFHLFPSNLKAAVSSGSGSIPAGNYQYLAVYEWIDAMGNLHRSAPSSQNITSAEDTGALSVNVPSSNSTVIISFPVLRLSSIYKILGIKTAIYRTSSDGTIFYRLGVAANGSSSFEDNFSDVTGNSQLYTTGGEVENIAPPSANIMTSFKNRIIAVQADNPYVWWFSQQVLNNFPVEFSDLLIQNIDQKGGPITAVSTMDDKLVFFKNSTIWYVFGDGPASNGSDNTFTYPQIISSDTGCINQDSIVLTPQGLMFQSPKGIYLLSRDLSLNYIGSPVEAYNKDTVTSVQMIAGTNQIRFSLNTGVVLCYDYFVNQWSVFSNISAVDSVIYEDNFSYLTDEGTVSIETANQYLDNGSPISMSFTTGWMKLSDLQGFERLKKLLILGLSSGPSIITTSFNYDYNASDNQPITPINVPGSITRMQYRLFPPRQKGEAFQLIFNETPAANSAGVTQISNLALEIGIKKGPYKLPASNSYG